MENNFKNIFEVRKSLRFELLPYEKTREILKWSNDYLNISPAILDIKKDYFEEGFNFNEFIVSKIEDFLEKSNKLYKFLKNILDSFYDESTKIFFDMKLAKSYFKNIANLKNIETFPQLKKKLKELENNYKELLSWFEVKKEEKIASKKSDFLKNIRKLALLNKTLINILYILSVNGTDASLIEKKENLWLDEFEKLNNSIIAYNENNTSGFIWWKFTLNKYSLFRRLSENLKEKYEYYKDLLNQPVSKINNFSEEFEGIKNIDLEDEELTTKLNTLDLNKSLDQVISELDFILGQYLNKKIQKLLENKKSLEYVYQNEKIGFVKKVLNLDFGDKWKKITTKNNQTLIWYNYINYFWKNFDELIEEEKNEIWDNFLNLDNENKILELKKIKLDINLYDIDKNKEKIIEKLFIEYRKLTKKFVNILFKQILDNYIKIKQFRDKLAQYRWKLRQDFKTAEREFINEELIRYYWNILEKDWQFFLVLTKKENIKDKKIENIEIEKYIKNKKENNDFKTFQYSQLSFSSIEKLALQKWWSLASKTMVILWNKYKNQKKCDTNIDLNLFKKYIEKIIKKIKENTDEDWTFLISWIFEQKSIEDIISYINHNWYKIEEKYINDERVFDLANNWEILLFQIYNKDFNVLNDSFVPDNENLINLDNWKKEHWFDTKTIEKTTRLKDCKPNLFTLYWKNIFTDKKVYLWQEWWLFFRKADPKNNKKRFRNNKFFISFDIRFNKWFDNSKTKLCKNKEEKIKDHIKNMTLNQLNRVKNKEEIIIMWIDRGSIAENNNKENNNIAVIWYSILKLDKNFKLIDVLDWWYINWYNAKKVKLAKSWLWDKNKYQYIEKWQEVGEKDNNNLDINFTKIFVELKSEIEKWIKSKQEVIKIINKKEWLSSLVVKSIIDLFIKYKVDFIAFENLEEEFEEFEKSFKEKQYDSALSVVLHSNTEKWLINKLNYLFLKDNSDYIWSQYTPNIKLDNIKKYEIKDILWIELENFENYKIFGNIIYVETAWTSSTCFNCWNKIKKHKIKCENCGIIQKDDKKINLKEYKEDFVPKKLLEKIISSWWTMKFNDDARAGFVIAKRWVELLKNILNK